MFSLQSKFANRLPRAVFSLLAIIQNGYRIQKQFIGFLILALISASSYGQFEITSLKASTLPKSIKYKGHLVHAVKWHDSLGINYEVASETGIYNDDKESDGSYGLSASLYVYHYVVNNDSTKLLWKIYDFTKDCGFDLTVAFYRNLFIVTDLDSNGIAEAWVMYQNNCTSDISPVDAKIIMYGHYALDNNFKNGNPLFRQYAIRLWKSAEQWLEKSERKNLH